MKVPKLIETKIVKTNVQELCFVFSINEKRFEILLQFVSSKSKILYSSFSVNKALLEYKFIKKPLANLPEWLTLKQVHALFHDLSKSERTRAKELECFDKQICNQIYNLIDKDKFIRCATFIGVAARSHPKHPELYSLTDIWRNSKDLFEDRYGNMSYIQNKTYTGKQPGIWLKTNIASIKELISLLNSNTKYRSIKNIGGNWKIDTKTKKPYIATIKGGLVQNQGTYVHSSILFLYMQWLHPVLNKRIIDKMYKIDWK